MAQRFITKVISGGQTGIDRIGLKVAQILGIKTGGTAPKKFLCVDGPCAWLGTEFGLVELQYGGTISQQLMLRSKKNVDDSNATIAFQMHPSIGTGKTLMYARDGIWPRLAPITIQPCNNPYRPFHIIGAEILTSDGMHATRTALADFLKKNRPRIVNVIGHRNDGTNEMMMFQNAAEELLVDVLGEFGANE